MFWFTLGVIFSFRQWLSCLCELSIRCLSILAKYNQAFEQDVGTSSRNPMLHFTGKSANRTWCCDVTPFTPMLLMLSDEQSDWTEHCNHVQTCPMWFGQCAGNTGDVVLHLALQPQVGVLCLEKHTMYSVGAHLDWGIFETSAEARYHIPKWLESHRSVGSSI